MILLIRRRLAGALFCVMTAAALLISCRGGNEQSDLMREIAKACPRVSDIELFDIYRGEQIGEGRKSMAFKIRFEPEDKALQPEDVDRFIKKILGNLKFKLGAEIR